VTSRGSTGWGGALRSGADTVAFYSRQASENQGVGSNRAGKEIRRDVRNHARGRENGMLWKLIDGGKSAALADYSSPRQLSLLK